MIEPGPRGVDTYPVWSGPVSWFRGGRHGDEGFSLTEVVVATVTLGALAASSALFFLSGLRTTAELQHRQLATQLAQQALELVRAVPTQPDTAGCYPFLNGRTQSLVTSQWAAAPSGVDLSATDAAWTPATCPSAVAVPTAGLTTSVADDGITPAVTRDGVGFTVRTYIGSCRLPLAGGACVKAAGLTANYTTLYRVIVAVGWRSPACGTSGCLYTASTLLDPGTDPLFSIRSGTAPRATADAFCTVTGTPLVVNVLANDSGLLGTAPVTVIAQPSHGSLSGAITGGIGIYTPTAAWTGVDTFTYRLTSTSGVQSSPATVSITVAASC